MLVYHRTSPAAMQAIQQHGFLDGVECYGTEHRRQGVLFSDRPPAECEPGDVLPVEIPFEDVDSLRRFEWPDPGHPATHRVWLIPAQWVNLRAVLLETVR